MLERLEVGSAWAARYNYLHLHTVRWLSGLPGYGIRRSSGKWPSRDAGVDCLRACAIRNDLDVRPRAPVARVDREGDEWVVSVAGGEDIRATRVVVATGYSNVPYLPEWPGTFAGELVH